MISMTDGKPSAAIMIKQRPGSNAKEVIENIKAKMEEIKESSFLPGMDYNISYDVSRFLDASISSVLKTLLEAFILVFIVVYIFLQNFRYCGAGLPDRNLLLYGYARLLDQHVDAVRTGVGHWYCGR